MAKPTAQEAARRLIVLNGMVAYACAMPPPQVWNNLLPKWSKAEQDQFFEQFKKIPQSIAGFLKSAGVWNDLSPKEDKFLHAYPQDLRPQDQINVSWKMEAAAALMWVLGILPDFPLFDEQTNPELLKRIPKQDVSQFIETAELRTPEELELKRSLAELWHWRSRTRQLIEEGRLFPKIPDQDNIPQFKSYDDVVRFTARTAKEKNTLSEIIDEDFAVKGKAYRDMTDNEWSAAQSIAWERHFALNWLCGYAPGNRWDETTTGT